MMRCLSLQLVTPFANMVARLMVTIKEVATLVKPMSTMMSPLITLVEDLGTIE